MTMIQEILFALYNILWFLAQPFLILRLWWRGRLAPLYRERWGERFGRVSKTIPKGVIWIHAVSVGESMAAKALIKGIQEHYPNQTILFTCTTPTASAQIQNGLSKGVYHCYAPYDIQYAVNRFLDSVEPRILILMESELWPNLLIGAAKRNIPVFIANARLSPRSQKRYKYFKNLLSVPLKPIVFIAAQSEADRKAFIAIGMADERLACLGNLKFDITAPAAAKVSGAKLKNIIGERPVWIAASTHAGEEEIILKAHSALLTSLPNALLILVPRHPERFDLVADLIKTENLSYTRRSLKQLPTSDTSVYLADTMGELFELYAASDCAFVGGSFFESIGGHNTLEPASIGLPVLVGPYNHNFMEITKLLMQAQALEQVGDWQSLTISLRTLLAETREAKTKKMAMGAHAQKIVQANQGAVLRHLESLKNFL